MTQDSDPSQYPTPRAPKFYVAYAAIVLGGMVLLGALLVDDKETDAKEVQSPPAKSVESPIKERAAEPIEKSQQPSINRAVQVEVPARKARPSQTTKEATDLKKRPQRRRRNLGPA